MEVHAHSHTPRKKLAHYFWEFLMLFLAVFCGFMAENQREHYIEHQREKQFMRTLLLDLKNDTGNFARSIRIFQFNVERFDSLKSMIKHPRNDDERLAVYKMATVAQSFSSFNYSDRTIEQLRNAGNFRLIRSTLVSDTLIEYDRYIRHTYLTMEKILSEQSLGLMALQNQLIDFDTYSYLQRMDWAAQQQLTAATLPQPAALSVDEQKLPSFYNTLGMYRTWCQRMVTHSKIAKNEATRLMALVKREYGLK